MLGGTSLGQETIIHEISSDDLPGLNRKIWNWLRSLDEGCRVSGHDIIILFYQNPDRYAVRIEYRTSACEKEDGDRWYLADCVQIILAGGTISADEISRTLAIHESTNLNVGETIFDSKIAVFARGAIKVAMRIYELDVS